MSSFTIDETNIRDFYDRRYGDAYMDRHDDVEWLRVKGTLAEIPQANTAILDYGCGQGRWVDLLVELFPAARIFGADISTRSIEKARQRHPGCEFHVFDGRSAPFLDQSFDLIFTYHVLEHVLYLGDTVAEINRLLRPSGYLCVIFPCGNSGSLEERIVSLIKGGRERTVDGGMRFYYEDPGHLRRVESDNIVALFEKKGVKLRRAYFANQFWGAVEWISKSNSGLVSAMFDFRRGIDLRAKIVLGCMAIIFSFMVMRVSEAPIQRGTLWRRVLRAPLWSACLVSKWFGSLVDRKSVKEWQRARCKRNGSAQYLIFQKADS